MIKNKQYVILILIVLGNVILKSVFVDYSPFSYDEIISVKDTLLDFGHIKHESEWDNNPPFYYYSLWVWHNLLPISEFNSRFLSVLFVSISIGLVYLFARKYFDEKTAIFTSVLLTLSNFLTFYSQETRTYALVLLLSTISSIQYFKYIGKPNIPSLVLLSFVNFLIIYSHYIAGIIIMVQYIMTLCFFRKHIKIYFFLQTFIIAGLVFFRFTKKQFINIFNYNHKDDFWLQTATFSDLKKAVSELFFNNFIAIIFLLVFLIFIYNYFKNKNFDDELKVKFYCLLLGFISIAFLYVLGIFKSIFLARYLIFCVPFATLLVVFQLTRFNLYGNIILALLIIFQIYQCDLKKESGMDYRSVADVVKWNKNSQDHLIINTRDNLILFEYYYNKNNFLKYKNIDSLCASEHIYGINSVAQLNDLKFIPGSNVFLAQSFHNLTGKDNPVKLHLSGKGKEVYTSTFYKGVEFTVFKCY